MTDERQAGLRERAKSTLREMHERVHDLPWGECEVCGTIRIALAPQVSAQEIPCPASDADHVCRFCGAAFALTAQLPAQEERLDVERLARAVIVTNFPEGFGHIGAAAQEYAAELAAEYRALGDERP